MLYLARKLTDNQETLKTIYYSLVQNYFDYCDVVWSDCSKTRADKLQKLQNRAARIITRADYSIRSSAVLININSVEWSNLEERERRHLLITMLKYSITIVQRISRSIFIEPQKITIIICGVQTMTSNYRYLERIF